MRESGGKFLLAVAAPTILLACCELLLRLGGYPTGGFAALFPSARGLYPANAVLRMTWGPVPYLVKSNSLGLRGKELPRGRKGEELRVLAIGDSVTDGYFVDNEATWPSILEERLQHGLGQPVTVVNGASGGGSIDKEFRLLRYLAAEVQPDMVILTFVTNDIAEILGKPVVDTLQPDSGPAGPTWSESISRLLLVRTALGEFVYDRYLVARSPSYRSTRAEVNIKLEASRYSIPGGGEFARNAGGFLKRFARTDGLVLGSSFDASTRDTLHSYRRILGKFAEECHNRRIKLIFVYFPAYSQIYLDNSPRLINELLESWCRDLGIDFLDLTDGFRSRGTAEVLHLAPLDYHLNPAGNAVFADLLAERMLARLRIGR